MKNFAIVYLIFLLSVDYAFAKNKTYDVGIIRSDKISEFIFKKIADELLINFNFHYYENYDDVLYLLDTEYLDFAADITYTSERSSFLDFTAPIHIDLSYVFTNNKFDKSTVYNFSIPSGSAYQDVLKRQLSNIYVDTYKDVDTVFDNLQHEYVDAVIGNVGMLEIALKKGFKAERVSSIFDLIPVSIATKRGKNADVFDDINQLLSKNNLQNQVATVIDKNEYDIRLTLLRQKVAKSNVNINHVIQFKEEDLQHNGSVPTNGLSFSIVKKACSILGFKCQLVNDVDEHNQHLYWKHYEPSETEEEDLRDKDES